MASSGTKSAVLMLGLAVAAAAAGWGWVQHQRAEIRRSATALVQDASAGLRDGLRAHPGGGGVGRLEADARALDEQLADFGRVKTARERGLAYAAEEYALSARQILRELAREERGRERVAEGARTLAQHMNHANRGTPDFHRHALELKNDLEKRYFDYGVAAGALARELDAFPDSRAKLAAQIDASALLDEGLAADARKRAAGAALEVAGEMERARGLLGAR